MRLLSARIKGLKGIYSKSGKKEIFIDFTKCIHDIVYIIGKNGSGKSTLMSALHPLPDSPQMYIDSEVGEKELVYFHNGTIYTIFIQYPLNNNGVRATSKAFIKECKEGQSPVELNSNGTIGSYKDILFALFCLDPNFISLSHLSVEDRGLVEKKPAERKKFVSNILESIEVYNDIYKTLVKRSGVFKSMVNSITAKIDSIGDESKLLMDESAAKNRLITLQQQQQELNKQIAASEATIKLIDPDKKIQNKYTTMSTEFENLKIQRNAILLRINEDITLEQALHMYASNNTEIAVLDSVISSERGKVDMLSSSREDMAKRLYTLTQTYESFTDTITIKDFEKQIAELNNEISSYEKIFEKIGVSPDQITKDEYVIGLEILNSFRTSIVNIRGYATRRQIDIACRYIEEKTDISIKLSEILSNINSTTQDLETNRNKLNNYLNLQRDASILDSRPDGCNIDTCPFISKAIEASKQNPDSQITMFESIIRVGEEHRDELNLEYKTIEGATRVYNQFKLILKTITTNAAIIAKLPNGTKYLDEIALVSKIRQGDPFNDISKLYLDVDKANMLELYTHAKNTLNKLTQDYISRKSQMEKIESIEVEIKELDNKITETNDAISEILTSIAGKEKLKKAQEDNNVKLDKLISELRKLEEIDKSIKEMNSQLRTINSNVEKISAEVQKINQLNAQLIGVKNEIYPLEKYCNDMSFSLSKLAEYKTELKTYSDKYSLIELIKKYSSPTKGGIQTIFMQLYMDKTLTMSNQLLGLMFDGDLELLPYVINENEFRIPVKNNITNLITDDISNCSTSEKSMIAMIMSFVLAFQGSSVYNIIRLDEIDGGLDQSNRAMFPEILANIMSALSIEQCLIISHSSESDLSNVDIISLTPVSHETLKGNVIFQL